MTESTPAPVMNSVAAQAADWFARLQEEEASEQEFQQWQLWLRASPEHQLAFREIEQAWRLIEDVRPAPWASIGELQRDRVGGARRWAAWGLAATVLIALGAVLAMRYGEAGRPARFATETAEQRSIRLADGSRVNLGARSRITPQLTAAARYIVLDYGEAYFDVAPDPQRPFTVLARGTEIRALGTAFNVRTSEEGVLVSVVSGRIAVAPGGRGEIVLAAGQQATLAAAGRVEQQEKPPEEIATWREGRFEYRGEPLREVIADLNRYTDRPIVMADASVGALRYSGTVFPDHLDEWLQGIGGVLPVVVEESATARRIGRAR